MRGSKRKKRTLAKRLTMKRNENRTLRSKRIKGRGEDGKDGGKEKDDQRNNDAIPRLED